MKITVAEALDKKGKTVWTVRPDQTVYQALELMKDKDIGAVLVMDGQEIVGIFSERDYARRGILQGRFSHDTLVSEVMTRAVCSVPSWHTIDDCMSLMTVRRLRHLPVVEQGQLLGLLSIGDVVKMVISEREESLRELEMYVEDMVKNRTRRNTSG